MILHHNIIYSYFMLQVTSFFHITSSKELYFCGDEETPLLAFYCFLMQQEQPWITSCLEKEPCAAKNGQRGIPRRFIFSPVFPFELTFKGSNNRYIYSFLCIVTLFRLFRYCHLKNHFLNLGRAAYSFDLGATFNSNRYLSFLLVLKLHSQK